MIQAYLKIEGPPINGDCTAKGHEKEIEIISWNAGFAQPMSDTRESSGAGSTGKAVHAPMMLDKRTDSATAEMLKGCWTGQHYDKITLACYRASGAKDNKQVKYLEVLLEKVLIADYRLNGSSEGLPLESLALSYGKCSYTYVLQKDDGTAGGNLPAIADLETNTVS